MLPAKSRLPTQQAVHAPGYHPWRVTSFQRGLAQRRQTTQSAARRGERWDGSAMLGRGVHPRIIGIFTAGTPTSRHLRSCTGYWLPIPPGGGEEALGLSSVPVPGVLGPPWAGRHNFPHQRRPPPTSPFVPAGDETRQSGSTASSFGTRSPTCLSHRTNSTHVQLVLQLTRRILCRRHGDRE